MESEKKSCGVEVAPTGDGTEEINRQGAVDEESKSQRKSDGEASTKDSLKKPPPTTQQDHPQNPTRTKLRKEGSSQQTNQGQLQIPEIWKRYDLTDPDLTTAHEKAELEALQKQIWRPRKTVPYTGLSSLQS